jgi:hypothetical protein
VRTSDERFFAIEDYLSSITVGVRNSEIEDLHVNGLVAEADWRGLTVAAAERGGGQCAWRGRSGGRLP